MLGPDTPADRDRLDGLLVVVHLAEQEVDPVRPLEPPVAEQLGVVGGDDERRPAVHDAGEPFDLLLAVEHEVAGVLGGLLERPRAGRRAACGRCGR